MESTLKVYTTGYCSKEEFRRHCEYFQPCLFQHVHRHDSLFSLNPFNSPAIRKAVAENVVDISCSSSREFAGHPMKRTKTNLQLSEFLSAFDNVDRLPVDENLFLSQCCVHSTDPEEIEVIELEEFALSMLPLVIPRSDLQSINIWANTKASFSSLHYDANHNILVVAQGKKTLYLLPPSVTEHLEPFSAFLESPNHSNLNSTQFQAIFSSKSDISSFSSLIRVEVSAGEAVFIPEGWWHAVESNDQTVAFNFWFLSPLQRFLTSNTHMMPYVLRATAHALGSAKQSEVLGSSSSRDFEVNKVHGSSLSQSLQMAQNLLEQELLPACESLGSFRIVWNKFANEENGNCLLQAMELATPLACARVLKYWDAWSSEQPGLSQEIFTELYTSMGDDNALKLHQMLMGKQSDWAESIGESIVNCILGGKQPSLR